MALDLQSELFTALGNVASAGIRNQLGRPPLHPLVVLVREALQNCWDARLDGAPGVRVGIDLWTTTAAQLDLLRNEVLATKPPRLGATALLGDAARPFRVLAISDRGTSGLGGPTRADRVHDATEPHDFVDFLRNVGQPPDKELGGGTYGFGKAAFYKLSESGVICVHTHCRRQGRNESRFIAAAMGDQFVDAEGRRGTGRHWWGRLEDGVVEPVLGDEADTLAAALGLRPFEGEERGTTIAILAPILPERPDDWTMSRLGEAVMWHFWPILLPELNTGRPLMQVELTLQGKVFPLPGVHMLPPLPAFIEAMKALQAHEAGEAVSPLAHIEAIEWKRGRKGLLALIRYPATRRRKLLNPDEFLIGSVTAPLSSHVAFMRSPRLVVRYEAGRPLQSDTFEFAGVFLVDDDADRAFASAEPPTHDNWVPTQVEDKTHQSIVKTCLRRVADAMQAFVDPKPAGPRQGEQVSLGDASALLGELLIGLERRIPVPRKPRVRSAEPVIIEDDDDDDPGPETGTTTGSGHEGTPDGSPAPGPSDRPASPPALPPGKPRLTVRDATLVAVDGAPCLQTMFSVRHGVRSTGSRVTPRFVIRLEDGSIEREGPAGAASPEVLHFIDPDGGSLAPGEGSLDIPLERTGEWGVVVRLLQDAQVEVVLDATATTEATR